MDYTYITIDTVAANQNTLHGSHRLLLVFNNCGETDPYVHFYIRTSVALWRFS